MSYLSDKYSDLLKQAQTLAPKDSKCAEYIAYLADLRADGKPFNEKETAFLTDYVADPKKTVCPNPPSKLRYVFAALLLSIPAALAIWENIQKPRS
jgi:hypothetical protein